MQAGISSIKLGCYISLTIGMPAVCLWGVSCQGRCIYHSTLSLKPTLYLKPSFLGMLLVL